MQQLTLASGVIAKLKKEKKKGSKSWLEQRKASVITPPRGAAITAAIAAHRGPTSPTSDPSPVTIGALGRLHYPLAGAMSSLYKRRHFTAIRDTDGSPGTTGGRGQRDIIKDGSERSALMGSGLNEPPPGTVVPTSRGGNGAFVSPPHLEVLCIYGKTIERSLPEGTDGAAAEKLAASDSICIISLENAAPSLPPGPSESLTKA